MTKMTKRILSMVLTVLMIVSMVSVFTLPAAMAVEAENTKDYDAIFKDAYLINPDWLDGELVTDKILYFTFQGVEREVICDTDRCFNNWADAYQAVYGIGNMDASNIYTKKPVFIFAPGTYSDTIHIPANGTIMGNNAGISPNADMTDADWTADAVKANNGWKKNDARLAQETVFTGKIYASTRTGADFQGQDTTGSDESRFAVYLETGKPADPTLDIELDGVKYDVANNVAVVTLHHYDINQKPKYPASAATVTVTSKRIYNVTVRNSIVSSGTIVYANNNAQNNVKAFIYDSELMNQNQQLVNRDISNLTMERVFWHDAGTSASLGNNSNLLGYNMPTYKSVYTTTAVTLTDNIFYELAGGNNLFMVGSNYDRYHGVAGDSNREKSITHNVSITGNIFYNAKSEKSASTANIINVVSHDKTSTVNVNVLDNIFHQDGKYVYAPIDTTQSHTGTKTNVTFTGNTVTGDFLNKGNGEAKYFIDELAKGITINGVTFTKENTAVFSPSGYEKGEYTTFFAGQKYIFEIDGKNIFPFKASVPTTTATVHTDLSDLKGFENIIMPAGAYGSDFGWTVPANYYGANFGIDPIDKSRATADNNYDWSLSKEWGASGETTIRTSKVLYDIKGDIVVDGFTITARYWDDQRKTTDAEPFNMTFRNTVINCGSTSVSNGGRIFNLHSQRAQNGTGTLKDADFGKVNKDSFTIENMYVVNAGSQGDFFNEYVTPIVKVNNFYLDGVAAYKARSLMGFFKAGAYNTNIDWSFTNCNIRNGNDANPVFCVNLFENAAEPIKSQIPDTYKVELTVANNIFYNAVKSGDGQIVCVRNGNLTKLTIDDNRFIRDNAATGYAISATSTNSNLSTCLLDGNVSVNNNIFKGYNDDRKLSSFSFGDADPTLTNVDNHVYGEGVASGNANCQQVADIRYYCQGCDTYGADCQYFKEVTGGKGNHVWNDGVYNGDATCQSDGTKDVTCTVEGCGETNTVAAPGTKVAHKFEEKAYVANDDATCCKAGTETAKCTWCDETKTRTNATKYPATGAHVFGEYVSNNDATYKADGTKTAKCKTEGCTATDTVTDVGSKLPAPPVKDSSKTFKDIESDAWYKNAVDHAVTYGLISGVEKDKFGVQITIDRGMFITILARVAGVDTSAEANKAATTKFSDVASGRYYTAAIKWASENGIVAGTSATTFAPETAIERQQLAVMIVNFAKHQKIELKQVKDAVTFADAGSVAGWAKDAVVTCQRAGIITGYNEGGKMYIKPTASASRAEAAQMLYIFHSVYYLA